MLKHEEVSNPKSCLNRAEKNERVFVLLARDPAAAAAIRFWARHRISLRKNGQGDAQIVEAMQAADEMERYAAERAAKQQSANDFRDGAAGAKVKP